jgi:formate hydrogenlyase subunit 6/NADH:ubiquinone oxidoreductase subunit I
MRIGTMLKDVITSLFRKPVTQPYPFERKDAPERLRGKLQWDPAKCTGCSLCSKDCPSNALEVVTLDRAKKQFVVRYHIDRCTFCAQCVQNCRFKCMNMSSEDWELASLKKEPFTVYYGSETDLQTFFEKFGPQAETKDAGAAAQPEKTA